MAAHHENGFATWFERVAGIGVVANLALAVPTLLAPEQMLALASLPPAVPLLWARFAALLLVLLSLFYLPAVYDCLRYRSVAWLSVGARLAGVLFFATQPADYRLFGLFDLVFFIPEAILLLLAGPQPLPGAVHVEGRRV
ncbi:MAG: hypothetical protein GEU82_13585 [Luteitalea sp.]|nr:hypothetical protein [Luteitalea sp.]